MKATLGKWEIRVSPSGCEVVRTVGFDENPSDTCFPCETLSAAELEAGDFITRHVLERDPTFFEG